MTVPVLPLIGIGLNIFGGSRAKRAAKRKAARDLEAGEFAAEQYEDKAIQEIAIGTRAMEEQAKEGRLVASSAKAIGAASGAGGYEGTVAEIEAESDYRMLTALYNSKQSARDLEVAAMVARREGADAARASREQAKTIGLQTIGSALTAGASLYERYG